MAGLWFNLRERLGLGGNALSLKVDTEKKPTREETLRRQRGALVKERPASLEQRYTVLDHTALADEVFLRLRQSVFAAADAGGSKLTVFRESGRLSPNRPYFFVKAPGQKGWLCERSGAGWLVTPAEKIVGRDLFMRDGEPVDASVLYMAQDRVVMPRVRGPLTGDELLALAIYEQRLLTLLGLPCLADS